MIGPTVPVRPHTSVLYQLSLASSVALRHREADLGHLCSGDWKVQAHERDQRTRRGGLQARKRTRAIHRHLLEILLEYIGRLLACLDPWTPRRRQFERRADQARERLQFLERSWPESKRIVLRRLRAAEDDISVDSRSEVETLAISSSEDSSPEAAAATAREPARPPPKARPSSRLRFRRQKSLCQQPHPRVDQQLQRQRQLQFGLQFQRQLQQLQFRGLRSRLNGGIQQF